MKTASEVHKEIESLYANKIAEAIRNICENKHLYQTYRVDKDKFDESVKQIILSTIPKENQRMVEIEMKIMSYSYWDPCPSFNGILRGGVPLGVKTLREFTLPTVKMQCPKCDRIEPYNPIGGLDISEQYRTVEAHTIPAQVQQQWALLYQCQSCKITPVTLLIGRTDWKFFLFGRNPMERVEVPKYIPKAQASYYSDARIAFNSGQVLAGLFLLRTFVEQFAKAFIGTKEIMVDKAIDKYMASLPADFKDRFPSLRKCYDDLSVAIHEANPSADLFNETIHSLEEHFDAKRIFKL